MQCFREHMFYSEMTFFETLALIISLCCLIAVLPHPAQNHAHAKPGKRASAYKPASFESRDVRTRRENLSLVTCRYCFEYQYSKPIGKNFSEY